MAAAKITSKGQITLPKEIRDALGLRVGDRVVFIIRDDRSVILQPQKRHVAELAGSVQPKISGVTLDDMEQAIVSGAVNSSGS